MCSNDFMTTKVRQLVCSHVGVEDVSEHRDELSSTMMAHSVTVCSNYCTRSSLLSVSMASVIQDLMDFGFCFLHISCCLYFGMRSNTA